MLFVCSFDQTRCEGESLEREIEYLISRLARLDPIESMMIASGVAGKLARELNAV